MADALFLTPQQAADELQVDEQTIRRYIRRGRLRAAKLERSYRISREDWQRFISALYAATVADLAPGAPRPAPADIKPSRGRPRTRPASSTRSVAAPLPLAEQPELTEGRQNAPSATPAPRPAPRTLTPQERELKQTIVMDNAKNQELWTAIVRAYGEPADTTGQGDYARASEILTEIIGRHDWDYLQRVVPGAAALISRHLG